MKSRLLETSEGTFTPFPGESLRDCIDHAKEISYHKEKSIRLEFNGVINKVDNYVNTIELSNLWYQCPDESWYKEQKRLFRSERIENIFKK